jgi:hypothetical protein
MANELISSFSYRDTDQRKEFEEFCNNELGKNKRSKVLTLMIDLALQGNISFTLDESGDVVISGLPDLTKNYPVELQELQEELEFLQKTNEDLIEANRKRETPKNRLTIVKAPVINLETEAHYYEALTSQEEQNDLLLDELKEVSAERNKLLRRIKELERSLEKRTELSVEEEEDSSEESDNSELEATIKLLEPDELLVEQTLSEEEEEETFLAIAPIQADQEEEHVVSWALNKNTTLDIPIVDGVPNIPFSEDHFLFYIIMNLLLKMPQKHLEEEVRAEFEKMTRGEDYNLDVIIPSRDLIKDGCDKLIAI